MNAEKQGVYLQDSGFADANWAYVEEVIEKGTDLSQDMTTSTEKPNLLKVEQQGVDLQEIILGGDDWAKHVGEVVGKIPDIPEYILKKMEKPSFFNSEKPAKEIHKLVLIPHMLIIDGKKVRFTLNMLQQLMQNSPIQDAISLIWADKDLQKHLGDVEILQSYWIWVTKDIIPGSLEKTYEEQKKFVREIEGYECPNALEILTSSCMCYLKHKDIFYKDPLMYTRCLDTVLIDGKERVVDFGGRYALGLEMSPQKASRYRGMAAVWKLKSTGA